jgi:hypothetical protein
MAGIGLLRLIGFEGYNDDGFVLFLPLFLIADLLKTYTCVM